jgi:hypothetical protein
MALNANGKDWCDATLASFRTCVRKEELKKPPHSREHGGLMYDE